MKHYPPHLNNQLRNIARMMIERSKIDDKTKEHLLWLFDTGESIGIEFTKTQVIKLTTQIVDCLTTITITEDCVRVIRTNRKSNYYHDTQY